MVLKSMVLTNYIKNNIKLILLLVLMQCQLIGLTLNSTNQFLSYNNFNPANNIEPLMVLSLEWATGSSLFSTDAEGSVEPDEAYFIDPPLIYPSPFRMEEGGILGYGLSRSDIDLELRIYDMFGYEVVRKTYSSNEMGGFLGYNRLTLDAAFFEYKPIPAGVYFYVFVHEGTFFGKGKFAVVP